MSGGEKNPGRFRRFIGFLSKSFIFLILLSYVFIGASASLTLIKMKVNNRQPLSALPALIEKSVRDNAARAVTDWVRLRPAAETAEIIKILTPESGGLEPGVFFELARRELRQGHAEDALFWMQLGRYRMRFDIVRCDAPAGHETFDSLLHVSASPEIEKLLTEHPNLVKKSVKRVLDFDAKYPARDNPADICNIIGKLGMKGASVLPREKWEMVRQMLRGRTEEFLDAPENKRP